MKDEIKWVAIPGYRDYEINDLLQVRHKTFRQIKKFYTDENGYLRTNLVTSGGKRVKTSQHRLAAMTYIPNPDNKKEVNHIDGNKKNNILTNLEWCTQAENKRHAVKNGLISCKVTEEGVVFIREKYNELGDEFLAEKYGVGIFTIRGIASGKSRKHISAPCVEIVFDKTKKIIDINTGSIYNSTQELADLIGISYKDLIKRLSGELANYTPFRYFDKKKGTNTALYKRILEYPMCEFDRKTRKFCGMTL